MRKRALVVGINAYRDVPSLRGCVNDTTNIRLALKELAGFGNDDIRLLVDARASRSAIEHRLSWLVEGAKPGDLLVLHFAGHGSQVRDRDEQDELSDQLDEILCPWDMDWNGTFITDDYLERELKVPPGVTLEVVLDCCNSGDGSVELGFAAAASSGASPDRRPRFVQPPPDIVSRHEGDALPRRELFSKREPSRMVLWSACAAAQTAADASIDGTPNGAFTFYFCKHLRETQGRISRSELLGRVRASLAQAGYAQVPELAAPPALQSARTFGS